MRRLCFLLVFITHFLGLVATEYKPWFGRSLEFDLRFTEIFQRYTKFNFEHHNYAFHGNNYLGDFSLSLPYDNMSGELECWVVDTKQRNFCVDSLKFTGRYMLLDEALDNPLNLTLGLSMTQTFGKAVHDIALFHHGKLAFDAHAAVGKEFPWNSYWSSRVWGVFGLGKADIGAPWLWSELAWEQRSCLGHFVRVFAYYRHGFGVHHSHLHTLWQLNYRALDLGARYTHLFDNYCELSFEYAYRCCVKNGLANMNIFMLQFMYPFGL